MARSRKLLLVWTWVLCIAVLVVPAGGAHWHLCLDGCQPPVTEDFTVDPDGALVSAHSTESDVHVALHDVNVDLVGIALAKKLVGTASLPMLTRSAIVLLIAAMILAPKGSPRDYVPPIASLSAFRFRPPLRAPPL